MESTAENDKLNTYFMYSLAGHLALALAFMIQTYVFPSAPIELAAAIRVDMVDLPDKMLDREIEASRPPVPQPKPEEKKSEPMKPVPPEKPVNLEKKQNDALAKLKQESAFEKIQKEVESENKKKAAPLPATFKGNQITSGTELRGLARAQHDQYVGSLERIVRGNWQLPEWLSNKNLRAQVRIKVNAKGEVIDMKLIKPSGNPSFDENVLTTVQKSSPLPPPPERLELLLRNEGIVLGFPE